MNISVIIPTYKKVDQLIRNLAHNLRFLTDEEVIVVNDDPEKSIADQLHEFPEIRLIENPVNKGFSGAVNTGISFARAPFVLLLNSDVKLKDTNWKLALDHFTNNDTLFAVAFAQEEENGHIHGKNRIFWKEGMFHHDFARDTTMGRTAWAEAGAALFDTAKLKKLGLFDEAYSPFYWEDIDLSYRAWKAGYEVIFDPGIIVEHKHESTISTFFQKRDVERTAYRNQFYFIHKNITDSELLKDYNTNLLKNLARLAVKGSLHGVNAYIQSLQKKVQKNQGSEVRTDKDVLALFA